MSEISPVFLRRVSDGASIEATLIDGVTLSTIRAAQSDWRDYLRFTLGSSIAALEHGHWDWIAKARHALARRKYRLVGIAQGGQMQGLMLTASHYLARLPAQEDEPLIYIEYISTAPWNLASVTGEPQYAGIGRAVFEAAITESRQQGWLGRIGLHSLPQSEAFYSKVCGMTDMGIDSQYEALRYFEMTPDQANGFERRRE